MKKKISPPLALCMFFHTLWTLFRQLGLRSCKLWRCIAIYFLCAVFATGIRMNFRSSEPFWLLHNGLPTTYPSLDRDLRCDVAIMGAGISGALISWRLAQAGIAHVVIDKRHAGMGSTCANTGLLQYEIDTPLHELLKKIGERDAAHSYRLCLTAVKEL
jgi:hypothetical protein